MAAVTDDQLAAIAAEADQAAAAAVPGAEPPPGAAPEQPPADPAEQVMGALELVRAGLVGLKPSLEPALPDAALRRIADRAVPVMAKYGWSVDGFLAKWGPELGLAAACFPVGMAVGEILKTEAEAQAAAEAAKPRPSSSTNPRVSEELRQAERVPAPLVQAGPVL